MSAKWFEEWKKLMEKERSNQVICHGCKERCDIMTVLKPGINYGRRFTKCNRCDKFRWLDVRQCLYCGGELIRLVSREQRPFECCKKCRGSFRWLD